jgi:hypothetical protein
LVHLYNDLHGFTLEFVRSIDEWKRFSYPELVFRAPSRPLSLQHSRKIARNTSSCLCCATTSGIAFDLCDSVGSMIKGDEVHKNMKTISAHPRSRRLISLAVASAAPASCRPTRRMCRLPRKSTRLKWL